MSIPSPTNAPTNDLIYGVEEGEFPSENEDADPPEWGQEPSMYVTLFEDILETVLLKEASLLSPAEIACIKRYSHLSYGARYLLVRLCLRKGDKWHWLNDLQSRYEKRMMGQTADSAMEELCRGSRTTPHYKEIKLEVIDLTLDETSSQSEQGPHKLPPLPPPVIHPPDLSVFADNHKHIEIRELLGCLTVPELRDLAKVTKSEHRGNRDDIISSIFRTTSGQATLPFCKAVPNQGAKKSSVQTTLAFPSISVTKTRTQSSRLKDMILKNLKHGIRLNSEVVALFQRINLIYFRNTQYVPDKMTPAILARARKRVYASYTTERSTDIWSSREALIEYEEALELEVRIDSLLDDVSSCRGRSRSVASRTPMPEAPSRSATESPTKRRSARGRTANDDDDSTPLRLLGESPRMQAAKNVLSIFQEVFPRWQELVKAEDRNDEERRNSLRRFECGHVLTRIVCKGADALGTLKRYNEELDVLDALLAQRRWRRGRRGGWHERKALILMTHMGKGVLTYEKARLAVIDGLEDDDTHMVYRPSLERRLTRIEKKLKLPEHECHVSEAKLAKANAVEITGLRIDHSAETLKLDENLKPKSKPLPGLASDKPNSSEPLEPPSSTAKPKLHFERRSSGKSIWCGRDGEEVNVETFALQYYEKQGFRGFHCEGRIVTTLFGLLFWDVIFASIPGAFETAYQSAPLDIAEDTFYLSRKTLVDQRLQEITDGMAPEIIERTDDQYRPSQTWCVGVQWGLFTKQDLLEIAKCLGGRGLATICQLMCEDYGSRTSGVPDLIIWNAETNQGKFVEVKGPGDNLQENQKVWIDVLVRAGVHVDVCYVCKKTEDKKPKSKGKAKQVATPKTKRKRKRASPPPDVTSEEEIVPINPEVESEDEEPVTIGVPAKGKRKEVAPIYEDEPDVEGDEAEPPPPSQASTQVEVVIRSRDEEGSCYIPATPIESRDALVASPPRTRKRVEVVIPSPRPFKRVKRAQSP